MSFRPTPRKGLAAALACGLLALSALAPAAEAGRVYKGKTAQRHPIKIAVRARSLKVLHFKAKLRCRDGSILIDDESGFLPTPIKGNGSFRDAQVGSTDEVLIRGHRGGHAVRGRIRVTDRVGKVRCNSKWIKFTARGR
jgi:hypothetical protein